MECSRSRQPRVDSGCSASGTSALRFEHELAGQGAALVDSAVFLQAMGFSSLGERQHPVDARAQFSLRQPAVDGKLRARIDRVRSFPSASQRLMALAAVRCSRALALNIASPCREQSFT